jgi:hypothetical protein
MVPCLVHDAKKTVANAFIPCPAEGGRDLENEKQNPTMIVGRSPMVCSLAAYKIIALSNVNILLARSIDDGIVLLGSREPSLGLPGESKLFIGTVSTSRHPTPGRFHEKFLTSYCLQV